jgi:cell division transport system ATP-binding protein
MIKIQALSYSFGHNWVLHNVNLKVQKGKFLFVYGASGAGKTTLLRILLGDLPLQRGEIQIGKFNLKNLNRSKLTKLRRSISAVFQDFKVLTDRTVYENVAMPLESRGMARKKIDRRVSAVLRGMNLENLSRAKCCNLSGGEQQRVAVSRAVVSKPDLLLADEPTGNLDTNLSMRLIEIFKQFNNHGTTIVLATHNVALLESVPNSNGIILEHGKITHTWSI